jgi:hypothetical protein
MLRWVAVRTWRYSYSKRQNLPDHSDCCCNYLHPRHKGSGRQHIQSPVYDDGLNENANATSVQLPMEPTTVWFMHLTAAPSKRILDTKETVGETIGGGPI